MIATSCTSDAFFGFEENYEGLDYQLLNQIAHSKEFINFQELSILSISEFRSIDTTQMVLFDTINGKQVFVTSEKYSIQPVVEARRKLIESYPEFENATFLEKNQIRQISLMDNSQLRNLAKKVIPNYCKAQTKSYDIETDAYRYMLQTSRHSEGSHQGEWIIKGVNSSTNTEVVNSWYIDDDYWNSIYDAIDLVYWFGAEQGGLGWFSDGSGIRIEAPEADSSHLPRVWANANAEPRPSFEFHVHPSGNLTPSESDMSVFYNHTGFWHFIFDVDGNYSAFYI